MFGLIWAVVARARFVFRQFMPTNLLLDAIHTRRGLKWGMLAMLLAVPYGWGALACLGLAEGGGQGWLNLIGLLFVWNALKFLVAGPVTLIRLVRVRLGEARMARALTHSPAGGGEIPGEAPQRETIELVR
ncbi:MULTISPECIES: sulfate permease [unclassified Agromyces]|uniref:sulfate permease n=1 Tax=unclassified Agromyces TaxID=2639701 RepID=UPI0030143931